MFNKSTWYLLLFIAFAAFIPLSIGFVRSLQVTGNHIAAEVPETAKPAQAEQAAQQAVTVEKDPNAFKVLIMGDSIAYGTGDEKERGISTYLVNYLKPQTTKKVSADNIAVNGLESAGLLDMLPNEKPQALTAAADMVVISIGGNDLREVRSRDNTPVDANEYQAIEQAYLNNLKDILQTIRKINPDTYIVFVGLYNPYEGEASSPEDTSFMNTWNYNTQKLFESDDRTIYVPTYDLFKYNLKRFISPDGLHPNALGYQAVSNRIAKSVEYIFNNPI